MANPLQLPFDFPPNATPTTHQLQANFNALLAFVQNLNDGVTALTNLLVSTLTTTSTATIGGALAAQSTAVVTGALTASSTATVTGALTANSTAALNGATTVGGALTANSTAALNGAVTAASTLAATGDITAAATIKLANGSLAVPALRFTNSGSAGFYRVGADKIGIVTSGAKLWDGDSSGNITLPIQPAFLATITSGLDKFGDGPAYTVPWDTEVIDRSSAFNMSTKTFTAAVDGVYAFVCFLDCSSVNVGTVTPTLTIVTSNQSYYNNLPAYTSASVRGLSVIYTFMDANDTMSATIAGTSTLGTKTADIDFGYLAGFLFG